MLTLFRIPSQFFEEELWDFLSKSMSPIKVYLAFSMLSGVCNFVSWSHSFVWFFCVKFIRHTRHFFKSHLFLRPTNFTTFHIVLKLLIFNQLMIFLSNKKYFRSFWLAIFILRLIGVLCLFPNCRHPSNGGTFSGIEFVCNQMTNKVALWNNWSYSSPRN